jgi:hypothetical protein
MTSLNSEPLDKFVANKQTNKILGWAGCFFVCVGAIAVTLEFDPLNIYALNIGALIYALWGYRTKQWNQVTVNVFLIAVYSFGLIWRII